MAGESEASAAPNLRSPEIKSGGLDVIRINFDPKLENDPELASKIARIQTTVGFVNAFDAYFRINDQTERRTGVETKLQKFRREESKLGHFNNLFKAVDMKSLTALQDVPGNLFGRESSENPSIQGKVKYPPGTKFIDIEADTAEKIEALADNAGTLIHDFGNTFTGYRGRIQLMQIKLLRNAQKRLGLPAAEISEAYISETDFSDVNFSVIDSEYKKIKGFMKSEAPELMGNLYPQEELTGLTFQETIDRTLKRSLSSGKVEDTVLVLNSDSKSWLQKLAEKARSHIVDIDLTEIKEVRMDAGDKLIVEEIGNLLAAYDEAAQKGIHEITVPISPLILEQMEVVYSGAKLRRLAENARQNFEKSLQAKRLKEKTEPRTSVIPTELLGIAPEGIVTPIVRITDGGDRIVFGIADNGLGVPEGFKIERGKTTWEGQGVARGNGIGLAAQAAEAEHPNYNGIIDLQNNPGGGAILTLSLPLKPL